MKTKFIAGIFCLLLVGLSVCQASPSVPSNQTEAVSHFSPVDFVSFEAMPTAEVAFGENIPAGVSYSISCFAIEAIYHEADREHNLKPDLPDLTRASIAIGQTYNPKELIEPWLIRQRLSSDKTKINTRFKDNLWIGYPKEIITNSVAGFNTSAKN